MVRKRRAAVAAGAIVAGVALIAAPIVYADIVHPDDVIIQGSACVGFDCVNGESFGFDTIRIKENNLRIKAQDTSNTASFPTQDWQITFNDSSNGGANKFAIDAIDPVARTMFTILSDAQAHALFLTSNRAGFGTNTPVVEVHIVDGDTPTVRLEQDGSSGFTPQIWDMAGNETNFFVRDVTNGSALPLRIQPGAGSNSLFIANDGDVGMGTSSPGQDLEIVDNANPRFRLNQPDATNKLWDIGHIGNVGDLIFQNSSAVQFRLFVDGKIRYQAVATPPAGGASGDIYIDTSGALCFNDGTGWVKAAGAGSCV